MSGRNLLLDSNIVIYIAQKKLMPEDFILPEDNLFISDITYMETLGYAFSDSDKNKKRQLYLPSSTACPFPNPSFKKLLKIGSPAG